MLWMTYLAGLETRRNEEYIQNLQNRLETGNRQLFKRNKYFFLPQNREVRRSKFAGGFRIYELGAATLGKMARFVAMVGWGDVNDGGFRAFVLRIAVVIGHTVGGQDV